MKDKFPGIYKNKIDGIKSKIQKDFYYHAEEERSKDARLSDEDEKNDLSVIDKINNVFKSPNFVYQADVIIIYKNGKNINEKIVGMKDNYLLTLDGRKIFINDVLDIK